MRTWVVVYQTNLGYVYGWLCQDERVSDAEENFWLTIGTTIGITIKCIAEVESEVLTACLSLYGHKEA